MRKLSSKQKKVIQKYWEEDKLYYDNAEFGNNRFELIQELEKINDYETIYWDVDRLIQDLNFHEDYIGVIKDFQ